MSFDLAMEEMRLGHPEESILLYRMASTEPGVMMPQIGRTIADDEAVKLIRDSAGTQFDPRVVEVVLALYASGAETEEAQEAA